MIPGLPEHARTVADEFLAEREEERRHVVVSLTGSHAYGFPSVDSDLDLKGIHIAPTLELLGLDPPANAASMMETRQGVTLDYASNELAQVLTGLLGGNGSYLERLLGPHTLFQGADLADLRELARASLSRRYHKHYSGFARGQLRDFDESSRPTAKKLLYVLRTSLTGTHLLRTGELVTDLPHLAAEYRLRGVGALVDHKRKGEQITLTPEDVAHWRAVLDATMAALDESVPTSILPAEPRNKPEVDAWLVGVRVKSIL